MNLLPPRQKEIIKKEISLKFYFVLLILFSFWILVLLTLIHTVNLYLGIQIPALEKRIEIEMSSAKSLAYGAVELELNELNAILAKIDRIRGQGLVNLGEMLRGVSAKAGEGISYTSVSYQGDVLTIAGHADTREQALVLKDALEKDSVCASLTSPLIVRETNVDFNFVCVLKDATRTREQTIPDAEEDLYD